MLKLHCKDEAATKLKYLKPYIHVPHHKLLLPTQEFEGPPAGEEPGVATSVGADRGGPSAVLGDITEVVRRRLRLVMEDPLRPRNADRHFKTAVSIIDEQQT